MFLLFHKKFYDSIISLFEKKKYMFMASHINELCDILHTQQES